MGTEKLLEDFNKAINESKKLMLEFVKNKFGEEQEEKARKIFDKVVFAIDFSRENAENYRGYYTEETNTIFLTKNLIEEGKDSVEILSVIFHEVAHAIIDKTKDKTKIEDTKDTLLEEAFANLFAEMCINFHTYENGKIDYISDEENEELKDFGYEDFTYCKPGSFLRSILYILKEKTDSKEMQAIKEYIFDNEKSFINTCTEVLGEKSKTILEEANNIDLTGNVFGKNDKQIIMDNLENDLVDLIEEDFSDLLTERCIDGSFTIDKDNLYELNENSVLEKAYCDKRIMEICPDINNFTVEQLKKIKDELQEGTYFSYYENGYSNYIKKFINSWYKQERENPIDFSKILRITYGLPFEQLVYIIENSKWKESINSRYINYLYNKYKVDVESESIDYMLKYYKESNKEALNEILNKTKEVNDETTPTINTFIKRAINNMELTTAQEKEIVEFFYKEDRGKAYKDAYKILKESGTIRKSLEDCTEEEMAGYELFSFMLADEIVYDLDLKDNYEKIKVAEEVLNPLEELKKDDITMEKIIASNIIKTIQELKEENECNPQMKKVKEGEER